MRGCWCLAGLAASHGQLPWRESSLLVQDPQERPGSSGSGQQPATPDRSGDRQAGQVAALQEKLAATGQELATATAQLQAQAPPPAPPAELDAGLVGQRAQGERVLALARLEAAQMRKQVKVGFRQHPPPLHPCLSPEP